MHVHVCISAHVCYVCVYYISYVHVMIIHTIKSIMYESIQTQNHIKNFGMISGCHKFNTSDSMMYVCMHM